MTKCSDVMTRDVKFCVPEDTVDRAARLMKDEDVGPIPVVQDRQSRRLVGIITDRDITIKVIAEGRDAKSTRLVEVMTHDPVTCRPDDNVKRAMEEMRENQVRRIPVVDQNQCLIGIIAQADIATRVGDSDKTADVVEEISH